MEMFDTEHRIAVAKRITDELRADGFRFKHKNDLIAQQSIQAAREYLKNVYHITDEQLDPDYWQGLRSPK